IAMIPSSWLGKGQLFYLVFLWLIVIANFSKALVAFSDSRIATEGTVMINALICTILILCCVPGENEIVSVSEVDYGSLIRRSDFWICILLLATTGVYTTGIRAIYGEQWTGWGGNNRRFGADADWRVKPILKSRQHNLKPALQPPWHLLWSSWSCRCFRSTRRESLTSATRASTSPPKISIPSEPGGSKVRGRKFGRI